MRGEKFARDKKKCCHTAVICICYTKYVAENDGDSRRNLARNNTLKTLLKLISHHVTSCFTAVRLLFRQLIKQ